MKITNSMVKVYEEMYKEHGMKIVLHNMQWEVASQLMKDIGVTKLSTSYRVNKKKSRTKVKK